MLARLTSYGQAARHGESNAQNAAERVRFDTRTNITHDICRGSRASAASLVAP